MEKGHIAENQISKMSFSPKGEILKLIHGNIKNVRNSYSTHKSYEHYI